MTTKIDYKKDNIALNVESSFIETVKGFPNSKNDDMYHNRFSITIESPSSIKQSFDYYGSYADYSKNITSLPESDIRNALGCIMSDGLNGFMDFEEFCGEYGYDDDSRNAERIHKACIDTKDKLESLDILEEDMITISTDINEDY